MGITTTELIDLLKKYEFGAISKKPREISLTVNGFFIPEPNIEVDSTGDGIAGPEICLAIYYEGEGEKE